MPDYTIHDEDDENIDYSDIPELDESFFADAEIRRGIKFTHVTVIVDDQNTNPEE